MEAHAFLYCVEKEKKKKMKAARQGLLLAVNYSADEYEIWKNSDARCPCVMYKYLGTRFENHG